MSDTVPVTFQFALGQTVRWAEHPTAWTIVARHYHEGSGTRCIDYGLALTTALRWGQAVTVVEANLAPWEGP